MALSLNILCRRRRNSRAPRREVWYCTHAGKTSLPRSASTPLFPLSPLFQVWGINQSIWTRWIEDQPTYRCRPSAGPELKQRQKRLEDGRRGDATALPCIICICLYARFFVVACSVKGTLHIYTFAFIIGYLYAWGSLPYRICIRIFVKRKKP